MGNQDKELSSATVALKALYKAVDDYFGPSKSGEAWPKFFDAAMSAAATAFATSHQLPVAEQPAGRAVDALKPFAALLQEHNKKLPDDRPVFAINDALITVGDIRLAAELIAAPHSPVAQMSGNENHVLHVLRNPFGFSDGEVRAARLQGADLIERYRNAYTNMRDFAEANGLDTKARNQ